MESPFRFDPVVVGRTECDAWVAYYRRDWRRFLVAAVGLVRAGFGMNWARTLAGAWFVLRANQVWAPSPDNDPDAARRFMTRFYALVARSGRPELDPETAATLEVAWWRVHRRHQHGDSVTEPDLVDTLNALYAYLYRCHPAATRPAAELRVQAMDLSDRWVQGGRQPSDPLLGRERLALVGSFTALRDAIERGAGTPLGWNGDTKLPDQVGVGDGGPVSNDTAAGSPASDAGVPFGDYVGNPAVQAEWDSRYADREQLWSGRPNGALVAEASGLTPGRALDVGCGEGADAIWLAAGGWDVTALEVSGVALERAARHARDAGVSIAWVHAELAEAALPPASFDLVSAQYPALLRTPDSAAERALLAAVAPGGVLLLVHHAGMETQHDHDTGFDPADYVWPPMVVALLDDDWEVELDEQRPRIAPEGGAGAHHVDDLVVRARRLR